MTLTLCSAFRLITGALLLVAITPVLAGSTFVSLNTGAGSETFTIIDEPTLVINGFDLGAQNLAFPVTIVAASIEVVRPVIGQPATVVVYEDPNGGTPQDARLISRADVAINSSGTVRIALPQPATTSARIVWVGFYLPVDFRFSADQQGNSVLTYWAWTPNSIIDLNNLASAAVFGPGDGSAPVNLAMGGIARISIELNQADGRTGAPPQFGGAPLGQQIVTDAQADLSLLASYDGCPNLRYDPADIQFGGGGTFTLHCRVEPAPMQPGVIANIALVPASVPGFERRGLTYQVFANGDFQKTPEDATRMKTAVTHCLAPNAGDINRAVIGISYGVPQKWYILPSQRYGDVVCAEVTHTGPLSYFVPRTGQEENINADLVWSTSVNLEPMPGSAFCNDTLTFRWNIKNDGFQATPNYVLRVTNIAVRTGQITERADIVINAQSPGTTVGGTNFIRLPNTFLNEANRLVFQIDADNAVAELNEANNTQIFDYMLRARDGGCAR